MALPTLTGVARLTADPELRFSAAGVAVCSMRLVFGSRKQDADGDWIDGDSLYIKATAFKGLAEHCAESLTRGCEVIVTGRVKTEQWTGRDGQQRSATALLLDSIGPSLRWNTATVVKAKRSGASADDTWSSGPGESPGGGQSGEDDPPPF